MAVKIRLSRRGKKGYPFYHIVVADSRAPRDGKFVEKIGTYNPNTNPITIELDFDRALGWLQKGAQPTDTCRSILSHRGVLYKKHLLGGVAKGAFSEAEADKRFDKWVADNSAKVAAKVSSLGAAASADVKSRLADEVKINEARIKAIAAKKAAEEKAAAGEAEEQVAEGAAEEVAVAVEAPVAEIAAVVEEVAVEAPVAEVVAEGAAEEVVAEAPVVEEVVAEAPVAEVVAEAPVAEVVVEAPVEETKE